MVPIFQSHMIKKNVPIVDDLFCKRIFLGGKRYRLFGAKRLIDKPSIGIKGKNVLVYGAGLGFDTISLFPY